ncbi:MAG: hypothetical protein WAO00_00520 [Chthoniobacterales bacterium]
MTRSLFVAICVIAFTASSSIAAEARLILRGRVNTSSSFPAYSEDSVNFYGTQVYLLESGMLRHRTEETLGHPAPADLKITAERVPNTSVILVTANSADEAAARSFLSLLVDEYLKFKREQKKRAFTDAILRLDSALKAASREAGPELQKIKQQLTAASVLDIEPDFEKLPEK